METQEAIERLYNSFGMDKVERNLAKRAQASQQQPMPLPPKPVDIYQQKQDKIVETNKKQFPKGASQITNMAVAYVVDGHGAEGLARAYKRARDDSESLKERGERERAEIRRRQYMQEDFLPAVEIVVNASSPDDLLNSKRALEELDKYALLEGSGKGYTASYIRQAYGDQLGQVEGRSDASVKLGVQRINMMLDGGQVRSAFSLASKLKEQIDKGEKSSSDEDYEMLGRVVAYYS